MKFPLARHSRTWWLWICISIPLVSILIWIFCLFLYRDNKLSKISFGIVSIILVIEIDVVTSLLKRMYPKQLVKFRKKYYTVLSYFWGKIKITWASGKRGRLLLLSFCFVFVLILASPLEKYFILVSWKHRSIIRVTNQGKHDLNNYLIYVYLDTRELVNTGQMEPDGSDITIVTHDFDTVKHTILPATVNTSETLICFSVSIGAGLSRDYYLLYGKPDAILPVYTFNELNYHFQVGQSGINIQQWRRDTLEKDGNVTPVFGRFMQKVTVEVRPVPGDHATNEQILYPEPVNITIYPDSYLEYDIRAAQQGPMRAIVCAALDDNNYTWNNPAVDNNGYSANWRSDLNKVITNRWYHRRIPLYRYKGQKIKSLCLMVNDYPDLKKNGKFIFYFDNIRVVRGSVPLIQVIPEY